MITLDPSALVTFTLPGYAERPEAERPRFTARVLTAREAARIPDELTRISELPISEQCDALVALVAPSLRGILSQEMPGDDGKPRRVKFEPGQLPDVLTLDELWMLPTSLMMSGRLSGADRKKSDSPSVSATAGAAGDAPAAPGGV